MAASLEVHVSLFLLICFVTVACCQSALRVKTTSGTYIGQYEDITTYPLPGTRRTTSFYGIRYGSAERFEASNLADKEATPQYASHHSKACYQIDLTGVYPDLVYSNMTEDCLTLNVYVPGDMTCLKKKKPVMIWVHPGGLQSEAAFMYNASQLALNGDVIVVTIQYRLGILGFLNIKDSTSVSNNALRDILTACKWVQNNIYKFGGNKRKVTIFGQSGGSIAVTLLVASPLSNGLFRRAMAMSGGINTMGIRKCSSVEHNSLLAAIKLNCNHTNPTDTLHCMQSLMTPEEVIESQPHNLFELWENRFDLSFIPCYGDDVLPEHPKKIYKDGSQNLVDFVMGATYHDGLFSMPFTYYHLPVTDALMLTEVTKVTNAFYPDDPSAAATAILNFYNNSDIYLDSDPQRLEKMLLDIQTDRMIIDIYDTLSLHSERKPQSYFYVAKYHWTPRIKDFITGEHGNDLSIVFGRFVKPGTVEFQIKNDALVDITYLVQKAWTNFGKTGDPNPLDPSRPTSTTIWPMFNDLGNYTGHYLEWSKDDAAGLATPTIKDRLRSESVMKFWLADMPAYNTNGEN